MHFVLVYFCLEQTDAALTVAIARSADMVARIALAIISLIVPVKARKIALIGVIALIFARIGKLKQKFLSLIIGFKSYFYLF